MKNENEDEKVGTLSAEENTQDQLSTHESSEVTNSASVTVANHFKMNPCTIFPKGFDQANNSSEETIVSDSSVHSESFSAYNLGDVPVNFSPTLPDDNKKISYYKNRDGCSL